MFQIDAEHLALADVVEGERHDRHRGAFPSSDLKAVLGPPREDGTVEKQLLALAHEAGEFHDVDDVLCDWHDTMYAGR